MCGNVSGSFHIDGADLGHPSEAKTTNSEERGGKATLSSVSEVRGKATARNVVSDESEAEHDKTSQSKQKKKKEKEKAHVHVP